MRKHKQKTPEELKAAGTFRASRHLARTIEFIDPAPRDVPLCPDYLPEAAREVWERNIEALHNSGLISSIDADALANYCRMQAAIETMTINGECPPASMFSEARKAREGLGLEGKRSRQGLVVEAKAKTNAFTRSAR